MANNKRVKYILKNASALDLKVKKLSWSNRYYQDLTDFRVTINLFGEEITGTGVDIDEDLAFLKGFSEAVERSYCKKLKIRTHGVAAHWSKEEAIDCSKSELIERDVFLCHYLTGTPAKRIQSEEIIRINSILSGKAARLKVYELTMLNGQHVILSVGEKSLDSNIIGLAANKSYKQAFDKSVLECLVRLDFEIRDNKDLRSVDRLTDPIDHYRYHLKNSSLQDTRFIKNSSFSKVVAEVDQKLDFSWEHLGNLGESIKDLNIYIVRGKSNDLQSTYYGEISPTVVNLPRLSSFIGQTVVFGDVEKLAHPLG